MYNALIKIRDNYADKLTDFEIEKLDLLLGQYQYGCFNNSFKQECANLLNCIQNRLDLT